MSYDQEWCAQASWSLFSVFISLPLQLQYLIQHKYTGKTEKGVSYNNAGDTVPTMLLQSTCNLDYPNTAGPGQNVSDNRGWTVLQMQDTYLIGYMFFVHNDLIRIFGFLVLWYMLFPVFVDYLVL